MFVRLTSIVSLNPYYTLPPSPEKDEGVFAKSFSKKVIAKAHSILYMPFCVHSITRISWSTLECLRTTSTVLLENNRENWKRQVLPSSVLSGRIKLWFKHQPKLDSFRHMVFTTAHIGKHI